MSCFNPQSAWYTKEIGKTGKRQITFARSSAHFPSRLLLPCGKCLGCLQNRARQWAIRCEHERKLHEHNCFVTLTYDQEKLPKGHTLVKRDLQLFMKRFRKAVHPKQIRFFACGEYGTQTQRPHYHVIIFGWDAPLSDRRAITNSRSTSKMFNSLTINRCWPLGHAVLGSATINSLHYVTSYLCKDGGKKLELDVTCSDGEIIRLQKPFSLMSRNPGIGSAYVDKYKKELIAHDNVVVDGQITNLPRFYTDRLLKKEYVSKTQMDKTKLKRVRAMRPFKKENHPDRRRVREKYQHLKLKHFSKGAL